MNRDARAAKCLASDIIPSSNTWNNEVIATRRTAGEIL